MWNELRLVGKKNRFLDNNPIISVNILSLKNNIIDSVKTTANLYNALKKISWLYHQTGWGNKENKIKIVFRYLPPIGKLHLWVRNNEGSDAFIISEIFKNETYKISRDKNVKRILDVGANAGFAALYFLRYFPEATVACIEPMPHNIHILKENLSLNNAMSVVFEAAATTENEKIIMEIGNKDYGSKISGIPFGKSMNNGIIEVDGLSITTILEKLGWSSVDIMKIDIEGYEAMLLTRNNGWLAKVTTIIMEIHEGVTIDFIRQATDSYGFYYVKFRKGNWILSKDQIV